MMQGLWMTGLRVLSRRSSTGMMLWTNPGYRSGRRKGQELHNIKHMVNELLPRASIHTRLLPALWMAGCPHDLRDIGHRWTNRPAWPIYPQHPAVPPVVRRSGHRPAAGTKADFPQAREQSMTRLILASASSSRRRMLVDSGVQVDCVPARVDEDTIRTALLAEGARPRDVADALAEMKARKVSERDGAAVVIGSDQVLEFQGELWGKPDERDAARAQLQRLRGQTHRLLSAVVVYEATKPVWRHVGEVRLTMRDFSDAFLDDYLARNWDSARHSVGAYKLEEEGVRLFSAVEGDYFTVLGLPLLPLLSYFGLRGWIAA